MSVNLYTTTGILVPGIFTKGTDVKLVFRDKRIGEMTDVFCVPSSELTEEQIEKKGLTESEIDWEAPVEPKLPAPSPEDVAVHQQAVKEMKSIVGAMNTNERARKDIAGWKRDILVKTRGGSFAIFIDDGNIWLVERDPAHADFVVVSEDPLTLLNGLSYKGAITDSVINEKLWISKNMEFTTIFKLDRMARSVARSKKVTKT